MGWFGALAGRRQVPLIGLDLSSTRARLVELERDRSGRWSLVRLASEPLDKGWISEGHVERLDEVADAVRRVVARSGTRTRRVAMALPASAVITRRIRAPAGLRDDEMLAQVELEMQPHIPFALDDLSLDFCVLGPPMGDEVEVFVVASRRDRVEDRQAVAEAAGLVAEILDVDSHAATRALGRCLAEDATLAADALIALVTLGADTTRLRVLQGEETLYDRDQPFGGAQLTLALAQTLGTDFEQAERRKTSEDLSSPAFQGAVSTFVDAQAREIGRALQYFFTSTPHHEVDRIVLAGGGATVPGLAQRVAAITGFPTSAVDPFEAMEIAHGLSRDRLAREAPAHLTACGLAMRGHLG